jgi:hypothetical protein
MSSRTSRNEFAHFSCARADDDAPLYHQSTPSSSYIPFSPLLSMCVCACVCMRFGLLALLCWHEHQLIPVTHPAGALLCAPRELEASACSTSSIINIFHICIRGEINGGECISDVVDDEFLRPSLLRACAFRRAYTNLHANARTLA